jgi:hypothetical protein
MISCSDSNEFDIKIINPNSFNVTNQVVVVKRNELERITGELKPSDFIAVHSAFHKLPSQFDDVDSDGSWDELAFIVSMDANEEKSINFHVINESEIPKFKSLTAIHFGVKPSKTKPASPVAKYVLYGKSLPWNWEYYPFQMDGPAWENDKVGFRIYLDGRNAKDIFAKRIAEISLENVGLDTLGNPVDNYHVLADWGRDVLQVGNSLGAGGLALLENDSLYRLGIIRGAAKDVVDSTVFRLINNGPVRGIFKLSYYGWKVKDKKYNLEEVISIHPGEYCYHSSVQFVNNKTTNIVVVGMVNIDNDKALQVIEPDNELVLLTHDKQTYNKEYYLGMALAVEKKQVLNYSQVTDSGDGIVSSYYISAKILPGEKLNYSFYACCEIVDPRFADSEYFKNFISKKIDTKKLELLY